MSAKRESKVPHNSCTVDDYLKRAEAAGLSWALPEGQDETELIGQWIAPPPEGTGGSLALPDWPCIHQALRRQGVTLRLLWQEYRQAQPEGYGYSRFCELYQRWAGTLDPVLRQVHEPGHKMFVEWAGQRVPIDNAQDGSLCAAHVLVAVLGASNQTYVEAFANEQLSAWMSDSVGIRSGSGARRHAFSLRTGLSFEPRLGS
jgi:transposase